MAVTEPAPEESLPPGPLLRLVRDQRIAYLVVGTFNTANAFTVFVLVHLLLGNGFWRYMATLLVSHVWGVLIAFVLHRRFVFRVHGHVWLDLARFEAVNLAALGLNAIFLPLFVEVAGLPVIVAQVVAGGLAVVLTYFAHARFSFRRSPSSDPATGEAVEST